MFEKLYNTDFPLHKLIESGKEDIDDLLTLMVTDGQSKVNLTSLEGMTPLHVALLHRKSPDVECIAAKLILLGADINMRDNGLRRPFDYAVRLKLWSLASLLSDEDADAEAAYKSFKKDRMDFYGSKLIDAVMTGTEEEIKACLKKKPNMNFINQYGAGAIHYVITHCNIDKRKVLRLLLDHKVDVNLRDTENDTALNLTVKLVDQLGKNQAVQLIELLLNAGASTSVIDLDGKDARHLAIERRHHDIAELLGVPRLQKGRSPAPSANRIPNSSRPSTVHEIDVQTDPSPDEGTRQTEFFEAVKDGDQVLISELTADDDVNINVPDREGIYGIHYCLKHDDVTSRREIMNLLLENDANVDVQETKTWKTPLHLAVEQNDLQAVKLLMVHNSNIRLKNKDKESPFDTAVRLGHQEIADVLEKYRKEQLHDKFKRGAKKAKICVVS